MQNVRRILSAETLLALSIIGGIYPGWMTLQRQNAFMKMELIFWWIFLDIREIIVCQYWPINRRQYSFQGLDTSIQRVF